MPKMIVLITHTQGKGFMEKVWNIVSETGLRTVYLADPTNTHGSFQATRILKS